MATRKPNRNVKVGNPRNYSDLYRQSRDTVNTATPAQSSTSGDSTAQPVSKRNSVDWQGEYGYVKDDLRRLGIVTGILGIAILAAGFVL